jgi:hypothetical protein
MSSTNNNNNRKINTVTGSQRPVYKSFCKVCQDAGKPESVYTNHNVRQTQDKNSPVTCPTLLSQICRNCGIAGHSPKYCTLSQGQYQGQYQGQGQSQYQGQYQRPPLPEKAAYKPVSAPRQVPKNVFMVFEEEEAEQKIKEEKEAQLRKVAPAPRTPSVPVLSYAKIIALAPEQVKREEIQKAVTALNKAKNNEEQLQKLKDSSQNKHLQKALANAKINWADAESDEEGDEEESSW